MKKVILAEPRGFCAGVVRAIDMVERALEIHGPPVYVRKQIVHNHHVVRSLEAKGAVFVDTEEEVPPGSVCVFSAHGVSPAVRSNAARRALDVIDATCPLVSRVHQHARRVTRDERVLLLIGHADHEETEGTRGEAPRRTVVVETAEEVARLPLADDTPVAYLTQTTLSMDETAGIIEALKARFTDLVGPRSDTICYASQNRQNGVKSLAAQCDLVLVVGSRNSSNSLRMVDVARQAGTAAHLVPDTTHLDGAWLDGVSTVGVSSGASVPEVLVTELLDTLGDLGFHDVTVERTSVEDVHFSVPPQLAEGRRTGQRLTGAAASPAEPTDRSAT
ncbi:4-hydroxy-3-methylbut-2-enyl diphosphate reductase [Streptomyces roseolilacinus]|uniref:4-hydroxy-3-methylbut-2-enyl diphosphate reductase n=1 Tax=Streptomyces roseolilacinus TaxID=66904 RepID=UPI00381DBAC8